MEILKAKSIYKKYGDNGINVTALDNVNISISKGEFVCILGESGSRKSTLII